MRRIKKGFTLIEVSLFIAITGLLFVTIIVGTQNSIWQQKYNDATQNFANFLKNIYAEVSNTQGIHGGMSNKAIYGKLVVFGEKYELNGSSIPDNGTQRVFVYDVIGDASGAGTGSIAEALKDLNVSVVKKAVNESGNAIGMELAGIVESYTPIWSSVIETTSNTPTLYKGTILIARHPRSGTINTLVYNKTLEINQKFHNDNNSARYNGFDDFLGEKLKDFEEKDIDFCLNPNGWNVKSSLRRNIRIVKNARNASGVEIISDADSVCK